MPEIRSEVERVLSALIGLPMWSSARAVDMEMFVFGRSISAISRRGVRYERGEYALHVQCAWHLRQGKAILVGSNDVFQPFESTFSPNDFDWERPGSNRRDRLLQELFGQIRPQVSSVEADDTGRLTLFFEEDFALAVFPDRTTHDMEWWRFLRPESEGSDIVFTASGLEPEIR